MTSDVTGFDEQDLLARFNQRFGSTKDCFHFFSPGRVNLIGDHTDYTGGVVLPCGIDTGTRLLIQKTPDQRFRFESTNFDYTADLSIEQIAHTHGKNWINYPLGVIDQFRQKGFEISGINCVFSGNVPNGAGLSSSASIEVVTAFAINELFDCQLPLIELVKISMAAENEFVGMQCGIMDQFAVTMAQQNHAMFLNCESLDYKQVPLNLGEYNIVLANTNQRRELDGSAYNERVAQCAQALSIVQQALPVKSLGELSIEQLQSHMHLFENDNLALLRAQHVCGENARVNSAVHVLKQGDIAAFGKLMNESHNSLRDLYHVSSEPLDSLVAIARKQDGVAGARLTGAGFGGCTVNLIKQQATQQFIELVGHEYQNTTGLTADFYAIKPGNGVRQLTL
jgi:galactokinase